LISNNATGLLLFIATKYNYEKRKNTPDTYIYKLNPGFITSADAQLMAYNADVRSDYTQKFYDKNGMLISEKVYVSGIFK